jgi:integrase
MRIALTDRFCDRAKTQAGQVQTDYFDETVPGLALRVGERSKSWTLHWGASGKRKRLTLGAYPALSLSAARRKALEAKSAVAEGKPLAGKDTLCRICEEFLARYDNRSKDWYAKTLTRLVYPVLGQRPIGDIRRKEVVRLLDQVETENGPVMADTVLSIVGRIMNWHATRDDDFRSPIVKGMARSNSRERARKRTLSDDEIRAVWKADAPLAPMVRFLLLTGARHAEALKMPWTELEGTEWHLPAARNKAKFDLVRPLSALALACLPPRNGGLVFKQGNPAHLKKAIDLASGVSDWRIHDLRRTARSLMSRAGVPSDHAERCLGHVIGGIRSVYDRHQYLAEMALAYEKLAMLIETIVNPQPNVVAIRQ